MDPQRGTDGSMTDFWKLFGIPPPAPQEGELPAPTQTDSEPEGIAPVPSPIAQAVQDLWLDQVFDPRRPGHVSASMRMMIEHADKLHRVAVLGGKGNRFGSIDGQSWTDALDAHAEARMKEGKHPRPCWKKFLRKRLGIADDRGLKRWMASFGKTDDDAEKYLNEKYLNEKSR